MQAETQKQTKRVRNESTVWNSIKERGVLFIQMVVQYYSEHQTGVFILTWSLAVVWVDDEDTDEEELQAPPQNFP